MKFGDTKFPGILGQTATALLLYLGMSSAGHADRAFPINDDPRSVVSFKFEEDARANNGLQENHRFHSDTLRSGIFELAQAEAPLISPYTWSAVRNENGTIVLNGYVPDAETQSSLHAQAGRHALDSTSLARGAPDSFSDNASNGLSALLKLTQGSIKLHSAGWSLSGVAASTEVRDDVTSGINSRGQSWEVTISVSDIEVVAESGSDSDGQVSAPELPVADPYLWAAERGKAGDYVLSGNVPTPQLQRYLAVRAGDVVSDTMTVADGAPNDFIQTLLAGFTALSSLEEGRLAYTGSGWTLIGRLSGAGSKDAIVASLGAAIDISDWQIVIETPPPPVDPYVWQATKSSDGQIAITGHVPTPQLQRYLAVRAGEGADTDVQVSPGAPDGFVSDALAALTAVQTLTTGKAEFDGHTWSITGEVPTKQTADSVVGSLETAETDVEFWKTSIEVPVIPEKTPVEEAVEPTPKSVAEVEEPKPLYPFAARLTEDGIVMSGQVPAAATRSYLSVIAGGASPNGLRIAENPPENFILDAVAGLRALQNLDEGRLQHSETGWSLAGLARTEGNRSGALAAIGSDWDTEIALMAPETVCQEDLEILSEENGILFAPASARITEDSRQTIEHVVEILSDCPETAIHVEGHTDSDGDEQANLILSLARSEAVIAELVNRGISDTRLYAVAYGESLPIAPNTTSAGKSRNRRIVFTVVADEE